MKLQSAIIAGAVIAASLPAWAQPEPTHERFAAEKQVQEINRIEIKNFQDESLGRIKDLGIDLVNGRIVEVLIVSDGSLDVDNKIVAVPPLALFSDPLNEVYRLNVSTDVFKSAPAIDLSKWLDYGRSDRIAAAYRLFGQEPYFLEEGDTASKTASRPKVSLGYVERSSDMLKLPVGNLQNQPLGEVFALTLNVPKGRIRSVVILAPGNFKTRSIVPAMALSFNAARDGLLLDDTKMEFEDEPRYLFTEAAYGHEPYSAEESYKGPHTSVALEQGSSYRDIDRTVRINKLIRAAKINCRNVQVGTLNDRVTLRGWVNTDDERRRIGDIAIAASRLELVDNQIMVGKPVTRNVLEPAVRRSLTG
jgi:sporulation protein YlmC with PRC-barrel domain